MSGPGRPLAPGDGAGVPEQAYAVALASLPEVGRARLTWLLEEAGTPARAWWAVRRGQLDPVSRRRGTGRSEWQRSAAALDPLQLYQRYQSLGLKVHVLGLPGYPARLTRYPDPPPILFSRGDLGSLAGPTVALVGTRRPTGYGRSVAQHLGFRLARDGVAVVSGLAAGIDSAGQLGALGAGGAPVVGVAGTGLDRVYPESSRQLWEHLWQRGLLVSEVPLGHTGRRWSFPERNRIMTALADVVVVVESHVRGGSLITADLALGYGVTLMAVPGSVNSSASAGTNALIAEGALVARDAEDIEVALGLAFPAEARREGDMVEPIPAPVSPPRSISRPLGPCPMPAPDSCAEGLDEASHDVLLQVDPTPTPLDALMARTGRPAGELALLLDGLERRGLVQAGPGWWERRGRAG